MGVQYVSYKPKKILNTHKHADSWFWDKYSAHPYIGCEHGCEYCYSRETKYSRGSNPADFSKIIKIKENAPELLRKELGKVPRDTVIVGDYQPIEKKTELSRKMLQVILDLDFPVSLLEKSPLILRDLDLIEEINKQSGASVTFSIITTKDDETKELFEPGAPSMASRFRALKQFSDRGILAGVAFMPILPFIYDDDENLEAVVKATAENGGKFVLSGGLTLASAQREWYYRVLEKHFPELIPKYQALYGDNYGPECKYAGELGKKVSRLCQKFGIKDRMPRYVPDGPLAVNRRISERLQNRVYRMELDCISQYKMWAFRKAAWALEDLTESVAEIYAKKGRAGLESLKGVGKSLAEEIVHQLEEGGCCES
ncbi:MAG: radical SAM protein [Candidatus Bathyarchaeum sp.]|nr:MAG: radical SAM protein [Candidatus Bathyarchaeum sp.]